MKNRFQNLPFKRILQRYNVVKFTILLADMADFEAVNELDTYYANAEVIINRLDFPKKSVPSKREAPGTSGLTKLSRFTRKRQTN